ncbi:MAG: metal-dependent hydrolase [Saprospiraceae bacterium]|nr:metal-dependent hydrolase [Saprospiraceae bacterium]
MEVTYYGHACFSVKTKGKQLLFDPFVSGNPLAKAIHPDDLLSDVILVTHAHGDHVSDLETVAHRTKALLISNYEIVSYYEKKGLKGHPMNIGGKVQMSWGTVKSVSAIHSSEFADGTYGGNPGGFVISNDEGTFYVAGDTALTMDMQLIPKTCPPLDFAILPIGDNFTMGLDDAVLAAGMIECTTIIGCHYDTFGYIEIDHQYARKAFADAGLQLLLPAIGETITLSTHG